MSNFDSVQTSKVTATRPLDPYEQPVAMGNRQEYPVTISRTQEFHSTAPLDNRQEYVRELAATCRIPETWGIGPVRNKDRRCTDSWCYVLFVITLLAMLATAIWAFTVSDPRGIAKVYDSSGNICGQGAAANHPLLYLQTFEKPFFSVCVAECPSFDYNQIKYNSSRVSSYNESVIPGVDFTEFINLHAGNSYTAAPDLTEAEAFSYNPTWANGYFTQEQWNAYTLNYPVNCLPNRQYPNCKVDNRHFWAYDSYDVLGKVCAPLGTKSGLMFSKVEHAFSNGNFNDVGYAIGIYGWVALIAFALSFSFLLIMCLCPTLISYLLFVVFGLSLFAAGTLIILSYALVGQLNDPHNALRVKYLNYIIDNKVPLLILAVFLIISGFFVFYLMCRYRKEIQIAIPLLQYASISSLKNFMLIFLSAFVMLLTIAVFVFELYIILKIYATGDETTDFTRGQPYATYFVGPLQLAALILHIFGTYWLIVSLNNFNDFVCAAVTVNHFFYAHLFKPIQSLNVFCHTLGHHVGTVNYSLFYLPAFFFKLLLGPFHWLTASDKPNGFQRLISSLCCCCFGFYHRVVRPFTSNIYPITYMGSEDFPKVTKRHFYLTERYHDKADSIILVGDFFQVSAKLLVMIATVASGYAIYKGRLDYQQNISNIGLMFFIFAFLGYIIGSLAINLFATTYQTCVICWLIELDLYETTNGAYVNKMPESLKGTFSQLGGLRHRTYAPL